MDRYAYRKNSEDDLDFEKGRIRALRDERLYIQKKTFTKWVNSFLSKNKVEINDLFVDLADGRHLMRLLEIISGEKLGKPNSGKMRVHKIENVNKCLAFLHTKVRLESIGAEDIVDGNPRLTLGLIWTIILRFQIQEIEINVDEQHEDSEKKSAKDALLLWCQRNTRGYKNVDIRDFTSSWRDGLAFNALLHNQRPDVLDFASLHPSNHTYNLEMAFATAEQKFGISRLLDAEDVDVARPDEKSILTYVASYYHTFSKLNEGFRGGKKITNIISKIKRIAEQQEEYDMDSRNLLEWIAIKTQQMRKRQFANSLEGVQNDVRLFKIYMTREKPPKCQEKVNIEANFFEIEMKLKELRQSPFVPPEGQRLSDIDQAWKTLEMEEHLLESALRAEVLRQEKLEQYAAKFNQKVALRNGYLEEMILVLSDPRYGSNLTNVEASLKKHEAISADIMSREDRFQDIEKMVNYLVRENYHGKAAVQAMGKEILDKWRHLLDLLEAHQQKLGRDSDMLSHLRDLDTVHTSVATLQQSFNSDEFQKASDIDAAMQKLNLYELEINAIADAIRRLRAQGKQYASMPKASGTNLELAKSVSENFKALEADYDRLAAAGKATRQKFEDLQCVQQTKNDLDEVQNWINEKIALCSTRTAVKDLLALSVQQEKHKTFQTESKKWFKKYETIQVSLKRLAPLVSVTGDLDLFQEKVSNIDKQWEELKQLSADKETHLAALAAKLNLHSDLNEAESWVKDINSLVASNDYGVDEVTANALLNRHREVRQQIRMFGKDAGKLKLALDKLKEDLPAATLQRRFVEQRSVPQVKALYAYSKHGVDVVKGELMFLVAKSNKDWWNVRTASGQDGFAPATYLKEVEPKLVQVEVVKDVEHFVCSEDVSPSALQTRVDAFDLAYQSIEKKGGKREENLLNAIRFFNFKSQCERCKFWLSERQRDLLNMKAGTGSSENSLKVDEICKSIAKYENNIIDLRRQAEELSAAIPSRKDQIMAALLEVERLWASLDTARKTSERKISTKLQLEKFKKTCSDTIDWINEKLDTLNSLDSMMTLMTLDNMIRRLKALEREMVPINEKVEDVKGNYKTVVRLFADEVKTVAPKVEQMVSLHDELTRQLHEKGAKISMLTNEKNFAKMSKDYSDWLSSRRSQMDQAFTKDVGKVDLSRVLIEEIVEELPRKEDDYRDMAEIAEALMAHSDNPTVEATMKTINANRMDLLHSLEDQKYFVGQVDKFRAFSQEADAIDSHIASCRRLVPDFDRQMTSDELEVLSKKLTLLSAMIDSYEAKVAKFMEMTEHLSKEEFGYQACQQRRDVIVTNWTQLNEELNVCGQKIQDNRTFLELMTTLDNMQTFINEKEKVATDRTYRDPSHLRMKMKKHEVLDGEVKANGSEMRLIKMRVDKLREENHPESTVIEEKFEHLTQSWNQLMTQITEKYSFLRESLNGVDIVNNVEVINSKVAAIASELRTEVAIQDVKHCNQLIGKHRALHNNYKALDQRLKSLESDAADMEQQKKESVSQGLVGCRENLESLKPLFDERLHYLNESIKFHQLMSELNAELQWIQEKDRLISTGLPDSVGLMQVRSLTKRHKSLEEEVSNHLPAIEDLFTRAKSFDNNEEADKSAVTATCTNVKDGVKNLKKKLAARAAELETAVKVFSLLEEINEIEGWIQVKHSLLESQPVTGKDEDSILLYMTKQKAFELELDSYAGIISETKKSAQALTASGHPLAELVRHKDELLLQAFTSLQKLSRTRRNALMLQIQLHEFLRECTELRKWIKEKMVSATSSDLGLDYEHLEMLIGKYENLRKEVSSGKEKLDAVLTMSQRLKNNDGAGDLDGVVKKNRDQCKADWEELAKSVEVRGKKLEAAGEIHKFNRDIAEALLRIQEKTSSLGNETGKDIKSIQKLLRFQDGFENDLLALQGQLESLAEDSAALQEKYPGPNAKHIDEQLALVEQNWTDLKEKSKSHRQLLQANFDYQTFLLTCQDLLSWCAHLKIMLLSEEKVSSVAEAQLLKTEHDNVKAEIEAREENFKSLVASVERMHERNNPFRDDISVKLDQVIAERSSLHLAWQQKKVYLDQLLDLHYFMRDTKQIIAFYTSQERIINRTVNLDSLEAIEMELKFFDTNAVKLKNFEDRTRTLQSHAKKLVDQKHFDSNFIRTKVAEILHYQEKVLDAYKGREIFLKHLQTSLEFQRDVTEVEGWMQSKMENFSKAAKEYESGSLSEKIRFLQKYTVFENEVRKHEVTINGIVKKGQLLVSSNHKVEETQAKVNSLLKLWEELRCMSDQIRRDLQDSLDMYNFEMEISAIEALVREKEYMSNVSDIGRDLEHCRELQHKLSEANTDMTVNQMIQKAKQLAGKVRASSMGEEAGKANGRLENVTLRWNSIQDAIDAYKKRLESAMAAHQLISDMNDVIDIVAEKKNLLTFDKKTLDTVGADKVYQKCTTLGDFVKSLEVRVNSYANESHKLIREVHPLHKEVAETHDEMMKDWKSCVNYADAQLEAILAHDNYSKSMKVMQDQRDKLNHIIQEMENISYPETDAQAIDAAMAVHDDRKAALQIQRDILQSSKSSVLQAQQLTQPNGNGKRSKKSSSSSSSDDSDEGDNGTAGTKDQRKLQTEWEKLTELMDKADSTWESCKLKLVECKQYQSLHLKIIEVAAWLENKKAFLEADNLGESYADIDGILRKQQEFDRSLTQQQKSFADLKAEAVEVMRRGHFKRAAIEKSIADLEHRMDALREKNLTRVEELQMGKKCYLLLRKVNEMRSWMKEKLHVALDESYLDLTNIHAKLQRHLVFESEILANNERFVLIDREVETTCNAPAVPPTAKKEVYQQLDDLKAESKHLNETMKVKKMRLEQARKAVDFINAIDEVSAWMTEAEEVLRSDDLGKDVESAKALLKKQITLETELCQQESKLTNLKETCAAFGKENHFAFLMLERRVSEAMQRLEGLQQRSMDLKESLEDSLVYHEFVKDIHDALLWEKEKAALVVSSDFGKSLVEVQSMKKRHQLLEADISNHDNIVKALAGKGEQMIKSNHQQSREIDNLVKELLLRRDQLKDASAIRKLRLDDALESQQFFIQCHELMSWITEKDLMVSQKIPNDSDFMQTLLKRIDELELELATHTRQVEVLQTQSNALVNRGHFEKDAIASQTAAIVKAFRSLDEKVKSQKGQLWIKQKIYQFNRDREEMVDLISTQSTVAGSEDYGKDLYDVERLIHNFDVFMDSLSQHEEKLAKFNALSKELLTDNVSDYDIDEKTREVNGMWEDLSELANARREALSGAKKVHAFDKKIDDTLEWILEKEALLSVEINCQDNETIQDLKQRQVGLKQDVKAINDQIVSINEDSDSLISFYPDAKEHILAKRRELLRAVDKLDKKVRERDDLLQQNEQLLDYLAAYRELMSWASEFQHRMTSPELSENLEEATLIHSRHKLMQEEMKLRLETDFAVLVGTGQEMLESGHLMSDDIREKLNNLTNRTNKLSELWYLRNRFYEQHMDYLQWLKDIRELESWMHQKEEDVHSRDYGANLDELDKLMIKQLEMEEALVSKDLKLNDIKRVTLIESEFQALKEKEEEARREDEKRLEADRLEAIKKKEIARKSREKRREDERRRTQEIVLPPGHTFKQPLATAESESTVIPRFNTRRSLRQPNTWKYDPSSMPPVTIEDYLERKQQAQSGGRRATLRSWKTYYTVLSGQILCFFKDPHDFKESKAASPPILIHHAAVEKATDYTKKKHVIRLVTNDKSEFLFDAGSREKCDLWTEKLLTSATSDPGESVRQSTLNSEQQQYHYNNSGTSPQSKKSSTLPPPSTPHSSEPLYANVPYASGDVESDSISEIDAKEKRGGRLSKFLTRKHKA